MCVSHLPLDIVLQRIVVVVVAVVVAVVCCGPVEDVDVVHGLELHLSWRIQNHWRREEETPTTNHQLKLLV